MDISINIQIAAYIRQGLQGPERAAKIYAAPYNNNRAGTTRRDEQEI
tara:strand:- start:2790 stop:2930 length:141 start_codon:yes stop_codon:yes gene_type:complete